MKGARSRLTAAAALVLTLSGCGADSEAPAPVLREGSLTLGEAEYAFRITTCLIGGTDAPQDFMILGNGTTPEGMPFDIQADGSAHTVEMRVKNPQGLPVGIYLASFADIPLRIEGRSVSGEAPFKRISIGGEVAGRFQASCG